MARERADPGQERLAASVALAPDAAVLALVSFTAVPMAIVGVVREW